ncbi:MAG: hypothetical protein ACI8XG_001792, partial [Congregibacter sp.]
RLKGWAVSVWCYIAGEYLSAWLNNRLKYLHMKPS